MRARPANAELSCEARLDDDSRRPATYKIPRFVSFSDRWTDARRDHDGAGHRQAGGAVAGRQGDDRDAARDVLQLAGTHGPCRGARLFIVESGRPDLQKRTFWCGPLAVLSPRKPRKCDRE